MAIAASFAGAPMANAGTMTKPLHSGKSARFGLEAALLADKGLEGNGQILDMVSGFGAFYEDYDLGMNVDHHVHCLEQDD
jgi:aconitate decarboxylase